MNERSIWERLGEGVGFVLASVVLLPYASAKRRGRRRLRLAFFEWAMSQNGTRSEGARATLVRRVVLGHREVSAYFYVAFAQAELVIPIGPLSSDTEVLVERGAYALPGAERLRVAGTLLTDAELIVYSGTIDEEAARALTEVIRNVGLTERAMLATTLLRKELRVVFAVPANVNEWVLVAKACVELSEWVERRWATGYRG